VNVLTWVAVFLLGGAGSILRFLVDGAVSVRSARAFPYGTLVVNISGALLLGLVAGLALSHRDSLLLGTATIGAYTTFSTWLLETERLGEQGLAAALLLNIAVSLTAGVPAAALGRLIGAHL